VGSFHRKAEKAHGTTVSDGFRGDCPGLPLPGCGVVYKPDPKGNETVLHTFTGGADGVNPGASLLLDEEGNLYSTTIGGGDTSSCSPPCGCGVVLRSRFMMAAIQTLHKRALPQQQMRPPKGRG
jgi:hypothetical protein